MICPDCGKQFKNLGAHQRFCGKKVNIIIDKYMGKSLSSTLDEIRGVLKSFRYTLEIKTIEENGDCSEVELKIRIPIRR